MSIKKICSAIKKYKSFLITAHHDPEGDSLGSQLAMAEILRQLGKGYVIVNADKPPSRYDFVKNIGLIEQAAPGQPAQQCAGLAGRNYNFDAALVLDCPVIERVKDVAKIIGKKPIINIDHHVSNINFGRVNYVDSKASSTGEIMYRLAVALGCKINKGLANYLYLAILTDTGGFRYSNTTADTMRIGAELVAAGVNPKKMYEMIYEAHSLASRKLLGLCLNTLKVSGDGKIAWMYLTKDMFKKTGATSHDSENFVNFPRFIDGVKIAALFSDAAKEGFTKVNFRSNESWNDVNKIASKFGGGGHVTASGCIVKGDMKSVEKKIMKEIGRVIARSDERKRGVTKQSPRSKEIASPSLRSGSQ